MPSDTLSLASRRVNRGAGTTHIVLNREILGIAIYNGAVRVNVDREGRVLSMHDDAPAVPFAPPPATLGSDEADKTIVHVNGKPGVVLTIYNGTDTNPMAAATKVERLLKQIKSQLPPGMNLLTTFNQATYMKASVHEVYESIPRPIKR